MALSPWEIDRRTNVSYNPKNSGYGSARTPTAVNTGAFTQSGGLKVPIIPPAPTNPPKPPSGPGGGGGGGGGGAAAPQLSQSALNSWLALAGRRPNLASFEALNLPRYTGRDFYNFNDSAYRAAEQALGQEVGAARARIGDEMKAMRDYYGSQGSIYDTASYAMNPNTRASMERMFGALGTDPGVTNQTQREAAMADTGFGSLMGILAANERQRNQANVASTLMDERRFNFGLDRDQRMLGLQGRLAEAGARTAYDQQRFAYETEQDKMNYDAAMQSALANWQRQSQVGDANAGAVNEWRSSLLNPLLELMGAYPTLDYSAVGGLAA